MGRTSMREMLTALTAFAALVASVSASAAKPPPTVVDIGVLAFRGPDRALERWGPTAAYLGAAIDGYVFRIRPFVLDKLRAATRGGAVDFVLTNSGHYVRLEADFGISRIATLKKSPGANIKNVFGAVIFVRADRRDIGTLGDLAGKSFAAVAEHAFGGFQMAWRELKAAGIDPFADLGPLRFIGFPQDAVVYAVRDGAADAGTVRTGVLESMVAEGKIGGRAFRVLNRRTVPGFGAALSTRLYPEWPFAKLGHTDVELAEKVAIALLLMPHGHPAAVAGNYAGWTVPLDYQPVHGLFRELGIGPYAHSRELTVAALIRRYREWFVIAVVVFAMVLGHVIRSEYLVARRTRELSAINVELAREIGERKRAEEAAERHRAELAHVSRVSVMGEMASGLAHELNQPLAAIANYARGCARRLRSGGGESGELLEVVDRIADEARRAGEIIRRIRGHVRKEAPERRRIDVNQAVWGVAAMVAAERRQQGVNLRLELAPGLPPVTGDAVEIEQVILNLARNAIDAMAENPRGRRDLAIRTARADEAGIVVSVRDSGKGLDAETFERAFDPFFTTKEGGLGLGLAICQTIVESHGGNIWALSEPDAGTVFAFSLPAAETVEAGAEAEAGAEP